MSAVAVFVVSVRRMNVRVRVLETEDDVDAECLRIERYRPRGSSRARAFFAPASRKTGVIGTIVLPANGSLEELIPHESVHAVMHRIGGCHRADDETLATDVGLLSARITAALHRRGIEVMS